MIVIRPVSTANTFAQALLLLVLLSTAACERGEDPRLGEARAKIRELEANQIRLEGEIAELEAALERQTASREQLTALLIDDRRGRWGADSNALHLTFQEPAPGKGAWELVALLNAAFPASHNPGLRLVEVSDGMAHVRVLDPPKLGLRMGTSGAWAYAGSVTLTLTSIPEIDSVYFDFGPEYDPSNPNRIEMDHAGPGIHTRARYVDQVRMN